MSGTAVKRMVGPSGPALAVLVLLTMLGLGTGIAPAGAARARSGSAVDQIKASWSTFFRGTTPPAKKIALVQDGSAFAAVIKAQDRSGLAKSSSAKVTRVTLQSKTKAAVVYTVLLAGQPALKNAKGTALYVGHRWKVSGQSFCALLALEQLKPAACAKFR